MGKNAGTCWRTFYVWNFLIRIRLHIAKDLPSAWNYSDLQDAPSRLKAHLSVISERGAGLLELYFFEPCLVNSCACRSILMPLVIAPIPGVVVLRNMLARLGVDLLTCVLGCWWTIFGKTRIGRRACLNLCPIYWDSGKFMVAKTLGYITSAHRISRRNL